MPLGTSPRPPRDPGFGAVVADQSGQRLLNHDGTFNVRRRGLPWRVSLSLFNSVLSYSWSRFLCLLVLVYLVANAIFALGYFALGNGALSAPVADGLGARLAQAFFFSVQTFSTVGYGQIVPVTTAANLLMTAEVLVGMIATALATGIVFARFSRPVAKIFFSRYAVVAPYRTMTGLKFRVANLRKTQIIELQAKVIFTQLVETATGRHRRFQDLDLERHRVTVFPLHWTLVHPIDESSPLHGLSREECVASEAEVLVLLTGIDETFSQTVHARSSYKAEEMLWDADFASPFSDPDDRRTMSIDMRDLDRIVDLTKS